MVGGFGLWTQLAHGKGWTWLLLGAAVVALLAAVVLVWTPATRRLGVRVHRPSWWLRWCHCCSASLYPNLVPSTLESRWSLTIDNASSSPVHAEDHDLGRG